MRRVLLAVHGSRASRCAARHVAVAFRTAGPIDVHVVNVQVPLRRHVAQFFGRRDREAFHLDESANALRPTRSVLDDAGVPYSVHCEVGSRARTIAATASRLGCDEIVIGATRKNATTRLIENSVAADLLEFARVPVLVFPAGDASRAQRYGLPAGVAAAIALLVYAVAD